MAMMPMFPLGSVLLPGAVLPLHVFEPRYRQLVQDCVADDDHEFGVVLIERGQEVGGGEKRFTIGTVAQIQQLDANEDFVVLVAQGERRIEILEWLEEDPHPAARVRDLPDLEWRDDLLPLREKAEEAVRRTLRVAGESGDQQWSADVEISDDPVAAAWQLAAIAPVGPLDQIALLRSETTESLLSALVEMMGSAGESFGAPWPQE